MSARGGFRRNNLRSVGERVLLSLWVGGMWAVGYVAVPVIFHSIDDHRLAGDIAGYVLKTANEIGFVCGLLLLVNAWAGAGREWRRSWRLRAIAAMVALLAVIMFVLEPMLFDLKLQADQAGSELGPRFGQLHAIASILYLIISVLGLFLVAGGTRAPPRDMWSDSM